MTELDAYKKAKAENDERFMLERDEARAELDDTRAQLADQRASNHAATRLIREHGDVEDALADRERENEQQWQTIESLRFELAQRDATIARVVKLCDEARRDWVEFPEDDRAEFPILSEVEVRAALGGEPETAEPASESYTVEQISEAFRRHSHPDDWGVSCFYEDGLLAALRGEYDQPASDDGWEVDPDDPYEYGVSDAGVPL